MFGLNLYAFSIYNDRPQVSCRAYWGWQRRGRIGEGIREMGCRVGSPGSHHGSRAGLGLMTLEELCSKFGELARTRGLARRVGEVLEAPRARRRILCGVIAGRLGRSRRAALSSAGHRAPYQVRRGVLPRPRLVAGRGGPRGADGLRGLRGHRAALPGRSRSGAARGGLPGLPAPLHRSARGRVRCGRRKGSLRRTRSRPSGRHKTASLATGSVGSDARVLGIGTPRRQVDLPDGRPHENPLLARPRQIRPHVARAGVSAAAAWGFSGRTDLGR